MTSEKVMYYEHYIKIFKWSKNEERLNLSPLALDLQSQHIMIRLINVTFGVMKLPS